MQQTHDFKLLFREETQKVYTYLRQDALFSEKYVEKKRGYAIMSIPLPITRRAYMHILTFRLSIFGDYKQYTPTSANSIAWTQALQTAGYDFLPNIIQAAQQIINIPFVPAKIGSNDKRMQFVSLDGDVNIRILAERVDVEFTLGVSDTTEQYFTDKLPVASSIMSTMLTALGNVQGNRLAYYVDVIIPETENLSFADFYQANNLGISVNNASEKCVEWNHRFNSRVPIEVDQNNELCNAIFVLESGVLQAVNAATGEQQEIKGLHITADINTVAENKIIRFNSDSVSCFAARAQILFLDLLRQAKEKFAV